MLNPRVSILLEAVYNLRIGVFCWVSVFVWGAGLVSASGDSVHFLFGVFDCFVTFVAGFLGLLECIVGFSTGINGAWGDILVIGVLDG